MTDRVKGFVVTLSEDIRIDDVQRIKEAIEMITHIADVSEVVTDMDDHMARAMVKAEIKDKLLKLYESI